MERQKASGVAGEHFLATKRFLPRGAGLGAAAAGTVPPSATRPHKEIDYR